MNKMTMSKVGWILFLIIISFSGRAQLRTGISVSGGISNLRIKDNDYVNDYVNYFKARDLVSVDGFVIERFNNSRFSLEQGVSFETCATENNIPSSLYGELTVLYPERDYKQSWVERSYVIAVPLRVRYDFEPWMTFHGGISNAFYLLNANKKRTVNEVYALRGELGVDFTIQRFLFGLKYSNDLTPSGRFDNTKISFHDQSLSLRLGVLLNASK